MMRSPIIFKSVFLSSFIFFFGLSLSAQSPEQTIRDAENSINQKIEQLHSLAAHKEVTKAIKKLDEINKEINKEITWGTFDDKYREAKRSNPNFSFQIREDLPAQLEPSFWTDYEARCDRILSNQKVVTEGMASMVQLNNWDKAMAYGSQLKTMYETFTGAAENLGTANLPKFAYDLYGNMNDFIENYKKIEQAELEGIEIETFQVDFNRMNSKARRSKDLYNKYKRYIQSNKMVITDFKANIRYINKLKKSASTGPLFPLSYADRKYNWDYEDYQNNVKEICGEFEDYEIKCSDFKKDYSDIKSRARSNWNSTKGNIYASDDEAHKQEFLSHHTERWAEFLRVVKPIYDNTYQIYCVDNSAPDTQNTDNPFDGATAGGENSSTTQDNNSDSQTALFVIENWSVKSKMVSYGYGKPYIETSYDLYFPSIIPDSWRYIMNLKLDGEQIIKNTNSKLISVDRKNRKRMNCNFKLPDNKSDGTYKLELTVEVSEKIQSISTYITIEGNSVHQKGNNNSNNNNQKPDPQKDHTSEGEAVVWNGGSSENNNNSGGGYQPQPKTNANSQTNIPPNAFLVGTISNSGNKQGVYKAVELKKLMTYDRIVFKLISGKLEYIQLIWRKEGGSWETEYQGNKTDFNISKGLKNIPKNTTHLNFVVNAQHNRWSANDKACKMEVYLIPRAGGSGSSNFYTLMDEADLAFAINYWEVEQGPTNSSNPKQKSLDLLRKAARLINSEADFKKRLDMVNRLVSSSAVYVERINAFTVKQPFLELAGKTLHQFSSTISSATRSGNYSAADAYSSAAEMWRSLTSAAWLGEHPYNKMYCYEQEKKYRALGGN